MSDQNGDKESWIRRRAYQLWQESGESHGQHEDHWHEAERDYDRAMGTPSDTATGDLEQDLIETPPPSNAPAADPARRTGSATEAERAKEP